MRQQHGLVNPCITAGELYVQRRNKFDCFLYEIVFVKELKPPLNVHTQIFRNYFESQNYSEISQPFREIRDHFESQNYSEISQPLRTSEFFYEWWAILYHL